MRLLAIGILALACAAPALAQKPKKQAEPTPTPAPVEFMRVPDGGLQPQIVTGDGGAVHLLYFKGEPAAGDLFYARMKPEQKEFSKPIRVNSQAGSAVAKGTIRGGQLALGKGGRVHVVWNGSESAEPRAAEGGAPLLYTRLDDAGSAFEPQRSLAPDIRGLDGGGSVAADAEGNAYAVWHADGEQEGEEFRNVYMAKSSDEGETFGKPERINADPTGACGCCSLRAFADAKGRLYVAYRSAGNGVHRDSWLMMSPNKGRSFESFKLGEWNVQKCPMSSYALGASPVGAFVAWEFKGALYFAEYDPLAQRAPDPVRAASKGSGRKHPALAQNAAGERLLVWTEGTGWERGGALAWQLYGAGGAPIGSKGDRPGIPVWSFAAPFARADGSFVVVY